MVYQVAISGDQIMERNFSDNGGFVSSEDAPSIGLSVTDRDGRERSVSSSADLRETDRIMVQGIPVSIALAKALGLTADIEKAVEAAAKDGASEADRLAKLTAKDPEADQVEQAELALAKAVEAGTTTFEEANAGDTIANTLKLHAPELSTDAAAELVADIVSGELTDQDETWAGLRDRGVGQQAFKASVAHATQFSTEAAMKELGPERFQQLNAWSSQSASIRKMVIDQGIKRAMGKATMTWDQIYATAHKQTSR